MYVTTVFIKPFRKKELKKVLKQQQKARIFVCVAIFLLSLLTIYLFQTYVGKIKLLVIIFGALSIQLIYSLYYCFKLVTKGIQLDSKALNKYKDNDLILFNEVEPKKERLYLYINLMLYFLITILTALLTT